MWGAKLLPDGFVYVIRRFCKTKNQEIYQNLTIISEHSQNENNNAHTFIEMASKGKMIYTPSHWELLIQAAVNKSQCNVIILCYDEIIDCKS